MTTRTTMKSAIEQILQAYGALEKFNKSSDFALKVSNDPFMPLSIEKHGSIISVTHYFTQNGDLVPDPDMEFLNLGHADWIPVAIQHSTGHYVRAGQCEGGVWKFNARLARELEAFARVWGKNLLSQGFASRRKESTSA